MKLFSRYILVLWLTITISACFALCSRSKPDSYNILFILAHFSDLIAHRYQLLPHLLGAEFNNIRLRVEEIMELSVGLLFGPFLGQSRRQVEAFLKETRLSSKGTMIDEEELASDLPSKSEKLGRYW